MAKFYVCFATDGTIVDCKTNRKDAVASMTDAGFAAYSISLIECAVDTDTVRRLLGDIGVYATKYREVYRCIDGVGRRVNTEG